MTPTSPTGTGPPTTPAPTPFVRRVIVAGIAAAVAMVLALTLGPQHQRIGDQTAGDDALASRVRDAVGDTDGLRSLAVAEVTSDSITWTGVGNSGTGRDGPAPELDTPFELGSITKTFTAALFADAIERGEVKADDTLAQHIPELADAPAGKVTLGSLAQHRSGLPPLGQTALTASIGMMANESPYDDSTVDQLITDAGEAPVDPEQPPTYSNFGISLLGTALVRATDAADYPSLVEERITGPLGMDDTHFAATDDEIPEGALRGHHPNGLPAPRWVSEGYLPSGVSTFTTLRDTSTWAQALLTGQAPGIAAMEATSDYSEGARIGWAWLTSEMHTGDGGTEQQAVWHNGITAGFTSMLVIDPETEHALVVMSNTATPSDAIGFAMMYGTPVPDQPLATTVVGWAIVGLAALLSLLALLRNWRARAVLPMVNVLLVATAGLLLLWHSGPWATIGGWVYGLALAPALAAAGILALRARTVPFLPRWPWLSITGTVVAFGLVVGVTQLW